jgi:hypothetical protein
MCDARRLPSFFLLDHSTSTTRHGSCCFLCRRCTVAAQRVHDASSQRGKTVYILDLNRRGRTHANHNVADRSMIEPCDDGTGHRGKPCGSAWSVNRSARVTSVTLEHPKIDRCNAVDVVSFYSVMVVAILSVRIVYVEGKQKNAHHSKTIARFADNLKFVLRNSTKIQLLRYGPRDRFYVSG